MQLFLLKMLHLYYIIYQHSWSCVSVFRPTGMNCELHLCSNVLGHLWEHMQRTFHEEWFTGTGLLPNDIAP